jgi:hypothetical protein
MRLLSVARMSKKGAGLLAFEEHGGVADIAL